MVHLSPRGNHDTMRSLDGKSASRSSSGTMVGTVGKMVWVFWETQRCLVSVLYPVTTRDDAIIGSLRYTFDSHN